MPAKSKGRSRNSTPMSAGSHEPPPSLSQSDSTPAAYDDILDTLCKGQSPPPSTTLRRIADALRICSEVTKANVDRYDRGMRDTSKRKKLQIDDYHRSQQAERQAEEDRRERLKQQKTAKQEDHDEDETRPPAIGAHSLAPQDGTAPADDKAAVIQSPPHQPPEQGPGSREGSASSDDEAARPPPAVPQYQTFGPDPSTFDDPTVYDIRPFDESTPEDVKREIFGVVHYPPSDLHDLTCGTPPDRDFSNAKPANQVSAQHFLNAIEPYLRPLNPEDTAFLEERGDRVTPFEMPKKGLKSYKEVWAEEDGDAKPANDNKHVQALEQDDSNEEQLPQTGPMLSRLLAAMRPERREVNGASGDANGDREQTTEPLTALPGDDSMLSPSNRFPEASTHPGWRNSTASRLDASSADERVKQELRYIGFLSEDAEPDYEAHYDDDVASRLRYLQEELERVSVLNGARKARVLEMAEERMAQQEWSTIADDLDSQLNQAYLKRHRNIGKGKKQLKRPGGPGGGSHLVPGQGQNAGMSKPGVGEPIRGLMERRKQWNDIIGPVVDYGRTNIASETIFDDQTMHRMIAREKELWTESQEQA